MAARTGPIAWERVLVRHVVPAKRDQVTRLSRLLRVPFPGNLTMIPADDTRDLSFLGPPSGRWMLALRFARESWVPLFSGAADGKALFDANADSRQMEVAWIGCRPKGEGWFVRIHRAGKTIVDFQRAVGAGPDPGCRRTAVEPRRGHNDETSELAFRRLCAASEIGLPSREIRAGEREFLVLGARGKPVKPGLRGYVFFQCPALTADADAAAHDLAQAIESCDLEGSGTPWDAGRH
jgi:hypothetical protein